MATLAELVVKITGDTASLSAALGRADKSVSNTSKMMGTALKVGAVAGAAAVAGLGAGLVSCVKDAMAAEKIMAQTNAVLASTKGVSGMTATSVSELANSLSKVIPVDDELIQATENMLLTFTRVGKDVFPQATEAALNMATALGGDPVDAAVRLGKALNDPIAGVTALRKVGVQLTDQQEAQIKGFMAVNDIASAQAIILKELETEFGNSGRAAGETLGGQLKILGTQIGNIKESIGNAFIPMLKKATAALTAFVGDHQAEIDRFAQLLAEKVEGAISAVGKALQDNQQTLKDAAMGIAAVGKAMFSFGSWVIANKAALVAALVAIGVALMWASGPVGIAVGIIAIGAALGTLIGPTRGFREAIREMATGVTQDLDAVHSKIVGLYTGIAGFQQVGGGFGKKMLSQLEPALAEANAAVPQAADLSHDIQRFGDLKDRLTAVGEAAATAVPPVIDLGDGLGDFGGGGGSAAKAADALSETEKALIALLNAFNVSGLSVEQYTFFLDMAQEAMTHFNLTGDQLASVLQTSGLAAMDFAERIEQLTALEDLTEQAKTAMDAVEGLYSAFSAAFAKPTMEEANQNLKLAQLKEQRAGLIAGGRSPESKKVKAIDEEIEAIEQDIALRRAHQDVQRAELDLADKTLMTGEQQNIAVGMITTAMGSASGMAAGLAGNLFMVTQNLAGWALQLRAWIETVTEGKPRQQTSQDIYDALSDEGRRYVDIVAGLQNAPSFAKGGVMPYTGFAHLEKGEPVGAAAGSHQVFYGPVTVQVAGGGDDILEQIERQLR